MKKAFFLILCLFFSACNNSSSTGNTDYTVVGFSSGSTETICNGIPQNNEITSIQLDYNFSFSAYERVSNNCYIRTSGTYTYVGKILTLNELMNIHQPIGCTNDPLPALFVKTGHINRIVNDATWNYTNRHGQNCTSIMKF